MEIARVDRLSAEIHFAHARENLRALAALLQPAASDIAPGVVGRAIAGAAGALDGAARALDPGAPDGARVACPFCGNPVVRAATLCGFCWRHLHAARGK